MFDVQAAELTNLICTSASTGELDNSRLLEIAEEYSEHCGEPFRGTIDVTEEILDLTDSFSMSVGSFKDSEVPCVFNCNFTLPSGNKYSILIRSYPTSETGELITVFRDGRGRFVRSAIFGKWIFDRYTDASEKYAVYCCLAPLMTENVDLIIESNEVFVRNGDDLDTEIHIHTKAELKQYLLERTYKG